MGGTSPDSDLAKHILERTRRENQILPGLPHYGIPAKRASHRKSSQVEVGPRTPRARVNILHLELNVSHVSAMAWAIGDAHKSLWRARPITAAGHIRSIRHIRDSDQAWVAPQRGSNPPLGHTGHQRVARHRSVDTGVHHALPCSWGTRQIACMGSRT